MRCDLPTELGMPAASYGLTYVVYIQNSTSNTLVSATSGDRFKSVSANKYILYYEHSSTVFSGCTQPLSRVSAAVLSHSICQCHSSVVSVLDVITQ